MFAPDTVYDRGGDSMSVEAATLRNGGCNTTMRGCDPAMHQAPTARESEQALRGVRFGDTTDTAGAVSPLVLDLGCGFGVGLLSMVQPSPPAAGGLAAPAAGELAPPAVNVLGCDACALKVRCDLKLQPLAVHLLTIASAMCFTRHLHPLAAYLLTIASTMCFTRPLCASRDTCSLLILLATVYSKRATLRVVPLHLVRARVHFRWATRAVSRRAGVSEIRHASSVRLQKRR